MIIFVFFYKNSPDLVSINDRVFDTRDMDQQIPNGNLPFCIDGFKLILI